MTSSQRPGEITYYEELGVGAEASADEIREAFRSLARLLHPDQQTDPQLKEMAEGQMRKLNRIYAVLSDPARRSSYDESLSAGRAPIIVFSGSDVNLKKLMVRGGLAVGIVFGTLLLIWFTVDSSSSEVRGQEARGAVSSRTGENNDVEAAEQITQLRAQLRTMETERNSALAQLARLSQKQDDDPVSADKPAASAKAPSAATALNELATAAGPDPALASPAGQFTGMWIFSKSAASSGFAASGTKPQYPPDFIELTVTEQNGALRGQYHSRYQVIDHAISPDVDFDFNGTPSGSALNCAWRGPGGARGRMTLKLLPASGAEISWNATELGSQQWLAHGIATLIRR